MDISEAKKIAHDFIVKDFNLENDKIIFIDDKVKTLDSGWIFYYNSEKFIVGGDFDFMLMGNNPVFVNKSNGNPCYIRIDVDEEQAVADLKNDI